MDSANVHVLEERGLRNLKESDETGIYKDEEMAYSGVVRQVGSGKFKCFNQTVRKGVFAQMQESFMKEVGKSKQPFITKKETKPEAKSSMKISTKEFKPENIKEFRPDPKPTLNNQS